MERLSPPANGLTGAFDSTYLSGLQTVSGIMCKCMLSKLTSNTQIVNYITGKGAYAVVDRACTSDCQMISAFKFSLGSAQLYAVQRRSDLGHYGVRPFCPFCSFGY